MARKEQVPIKEKLCLLEKFKPGSPASDMAIKLLQEMIQVDTTNPPGNETVLAEALKKWVDSKKVPFVKTKIIGSG
nr:hypothetical protein [Candidatus Sigynarchaeota archaeon]